MAESSHLVQKLWNYCNILRDDGLSYGDYVEQLTFLLFLKMADEKARPPFNKPSPIPKGKDWRALLSKVPRLFSVVEELESVVTANFQRAPRLRQSILEKAFTGEL
jgi:type I restriction-modification system DNA methylase subunit